MNCKKNIMQLLLILVLIIGTVCYGQFGGLRSTVPRVHTNLGGFHGSLGTSKLSTFSYDAARLNFTPNPSATALRANIGGKYSSNKYSSRSTALRFTNPSLRAMQTSAANNPYQFGRMTNVSSSNISQPNIENEVISIPYAGGLSSVVLIPDSGNICQTDRLACMLSSQEALKPLVGDKLLRPNLNAPKPKDADELLPPPDISDEYNIAELPGSSMSQSMIYVAQQISQARNYIRKQQYSEALTCYQAASSVDARNKNAIIGTIYSHIMCGKFQAGGQSILRLISLYPDFWRTTPDFIAIFGVPATTIVEKSSEAEPDIDYYISLCKGDNSKTARRGLKLAYLAKMFLAWLADDAELMKKNIELSAQADPYDPLVQKLYRDMTGKRSQKQLQIKSIKPLE